jgi:hypothetical protein
LEEIASDRPEIAEALWKLVERYDYQGLLALLPAEEDER